jgi:hypothetical protein
LDEYKEELQEIRQQLRQELDDMRVEEWYRLKSLPC